MAKAPMVLSGVVPEIWLYGFLGAYFTHSLWFSLGVSALLWFMNTTVAIHRNDKFREAPPLPEALLTAAASALADGDTVANVAAQLPLQIFQKSSDLIIALNFLTPVSILLGILVGLTVVWALQLPPLLDPEPWHVRRRLQAVGGEPDDRGAPIWVFNYSVPRFVLGGLMAGVAGNFLLGNFEPEVSPAASLAIGIVLMVTGLTLVLYTFFRWYKSNQPSDWVNLGAALSLVVFMITPVVYDYLLDIRPAQGWLYQIALFLVFIVVTLLWQRFFRHLSPESAAELQTDVRGATAETQPARQWARWLALYVPAALIYLVGWIRDEQTQHAVVQGKSATVGDITQVLLAVALLSLAIEFVLVVWGYWRWRRAAFMMRYVSDEDNLDEYVVLPPDSPLLLSNAKPYTVHAPAHASTTATHRDVLAALRINKK